MKIKTQRRLRNVLISLAVICITPLAEKGRMLSGARSTDAFAGKDIVCAIDLGDDMYGGHGLETGLNYELLSTFAEDNHCNISIVAAGKEDNYIDSLRMGTVDIVITHDKDSLEGHGIDVLRQVHDCSVWAVNSSDENEVRQLNSWLSYVTSSPEYAGMQKRFHNVYNPQKRAEKGVTSRTISPYDELIKDYAAELGWDWRMLAAVVYQESKFSISSRSFRGAVGLMQVMPQTGRHYGVDNLLDPEENIKAGTSHLKRLQNIFRKYNLEHEELIKFTLAAYNAGEGRIMDCRNFAAAQQADSTKWDSIVEIIPLMREDSILEDESVRLGKFQGHETIAYVDSVLAHYDAFCTICPAI
ncbi:MAG: transglycosylase SLT domain-containing protein [Bacteroidales bacterium]|nr:transglycosylase SLT domain-containing protein [Bacteroidales bacterium]